MTGIFQPNVFQNDVFQVEKVGVGGVIVIHRAGDELKHTGANFSRKRWRELLAEVEIERKAAEAKAAKLKKEVAREAVRLAADAAQEAIQAARKAQQDAELAAELECMTACLKAAANTRTTAKVLEQARQAEEMALAIKRELEDIEDEEEAISLLLI